MMRSIPLAVCLTAGLCMGAAAAAPQAGPAEQSTISTGAPAPVAFVYVSNANGSLNSPNAFNTYAYAAAANGKLTKIPGSPFNADVESLGLNGKYLIGVNGTWSSVSQSFLDTYSIAANGAIKKVQSTNAGAKVPGGNCGSIGPLKIDHSGQVVYDAINNSNCFGTSFQFFKIDHATGKLIYLGVTGELGLFVSEIDFLGNNKYAYAPSCYGFDGEAVGFTSGFERQSDGKLTDLNIGSLGPQTKESGNFYCPYRYATDPTNHIAALLQDEDTIGDIFGSPVIATYTADANGQLTTASTYSNMPATTVGAFSMRMSPSGKVLAVGGAAGLELFHFNGANPVTKYKVLLTHGVIDELYWDKANHLYAIDRNSSLPGTGKLHVFTVTPTSATEAPGSPYSIPNPVSIIVQPR